jgi:hypothetical protein
MTKTELEIGKNYKIDSKDGFIIAEYIGYSEDRYKFNYLEVELKIIEDDLKRVKEL